MSEELGGVKPEIVKKPKVAKFEVVTSKVVIEVWHVEATNELEAEQKFWTEGKKVDEDAREFCVEEVYEL